MRTMSPGVRAASVLDGARAFSPLSIAIFEAFTTPPTAERQIIINTAVKALIAGGVWSNLDVLHVYAASDSQASTINWVSPGTYDATPSGTAFEADRGYTGDGGAATVSTGFNPTTAVSPKFVRDSASIGIWCLTSRAGAAQVDFGNASAGTGLNIYPRFSDDNTYLRVNDASETGGFAVASSNGFYLGNRSGANAREGYKNGASVGSYGSSASQAVINANINVFPTVANGSDDQIALACIGRSLSAGQALAFYNAALAYMQAVGAV